VAEEHPIEFHVLFAVVLSQRLQYVNIFFLTIKVLSASRNCKTVRRESI